MSLQEESDWIDSDLVARILIFGANLGLDKEWAGFVIGGFVIRGLGNSGLGFRQGIDLRMGLWYTGGKIDIDPRSS